MQVINILSNNSRYIACINEFGNVTVSEIGLGIQQLFAVLKPLFPIILPNGLGGYEILKLNWLNVLPQPPRAAEIRYTGISAHSSATKHNSALAVAQQGAEALYFI